MTGAILFVALMLTALIMLLGWLLIGGMHRSAHPAGQRPHVELITPWTRDWHSGNYRQPPTGWWLAVGPVTYIDAWGLELVWGYVPNARPGHLRYCHALRLVLVGWRMPRIRAEFW